MVKFFNFSRKNLVAALCATAAATMTPSMSGEMSSISALVQPASAITLTGGANSVGRHHRGGMPKHNNNFKLAPKPLKTGSNKAGGSPRSKNRAKGAISSNAEVPIDEEAVQNQLMERTKLAFAAGNPELVQTLMTVIMGIASEEAYDKSQNAEQAKATQYHQSVLGHQPYSNGKFVVSKKNDEVDK